MKVVSKAARETKVDKENQIADLLAWIQKNNGKLQAKVEKLRMKKERVMNLHRMKPVKLVKRVDETPAVVAVVADVKTIDYYTKTKALRNSSAFVLVYTFSKPHMLSFIIKLPVIYLSLNYSDEPVSV